MKKSVIVLLLVILLSVTFAYGYQLVAPYSGGQAKALPDLVITKIDVPDQLPAGSHIEGFQVHIKNIGEGPVDGSAELLVKMKSSNMHSCQEKIRLGTGTGTSSNPRFESSSRRNRGGYILDAGKEDIVYVNFGSGGRETAGAAICTQPLRDYVNITAEINPKGGKFAGSSYKGNILESNDANNILNKEIYVGFDVAADTLTLKFVAGLNAFSVPLITNTTVGELSSKSGCDIYKLPVTKEVFKNKRSFDTTKLVPVHSSDVLDPLVPYFGYCKYYSAYATLKGKDPGTMNIDVAGNGLTFLPIRSGMVGNQLKDYLDGCSNSFGGPTNFYSYLTVSDRDNRQAFSIRLISERRESTDTIIPGLFYFMYCDGYGGGVWDSDHYRIAERRAHLLGQDIEDDYVPVLKSRSGLQNIESNKLYPAHLYETIPTAGYRYGPSSSSVRYYYSPVRLVSYNSYS